MPRQNIVQNAFLTGEISPRMEMREDTDGYKFGVRRLENFFIHLQGPVGTCHGSQYVQTIPGSYGRLFPFHVDKNYDYVVVVTTTHVTVYNVQNFVLAAQLTSPWTTEEEIESIQSKHIPGETGIVMTCLTKPLQVLSLSGATWAITEVVFTNPPLEWSATNRPVAIAFFEGRMYLGGSPANPEQIWGSKAGDYRDFTVGSLAADALDYTLNRRGRIQWIAAARNLLVGTENAELILTSQDGLIIPGDIEARVQTTYGSIPQQAQEVGHEVVFITVDGRKARTMSYEWSKEQWTTRDLTFASEHITAGDRQFTSVAYAANPYSTLFFTTANHEIVGCVYEPHAKAGGFYRRTTQGQVVSVCVVTAQGSDEMWQLVTRPTGDMYLEQVPNDYNVKMDSFGKASSETPTQDWTAPHLALLPCQVVADGGLHSDVTPAVDGSFQTGSAVSEVIIGLKYDSILKTLPIATDTKYSGTSRPMRKRHNKVYVRLNTSYLPLINGKRPPERRPNTPMGEGEHPRTEYVKVINMGWDLEGVIEIKQDLPTPTEIGGIFGQLQQGEV